MAKSNSSNEHYDLNVRCPGVITVPGIVKANTSKTIMLNRKRDGSSKRSIQAIDKTKIIFVLGSLDEGKEATITFMDDRAPAFRKLRRVTVGLADKDTGMLAGQNEKGEAILINTAYCDLVTSKDAEVEGEAAPKKKKSSGKKSK